MCVFLLEVQFLDEEIRLDSSKSFGKFVVRVVDEDWSYEKFRVDMLEKEIALYWDIIFDFRKRFSCLDVLSWVL